MWKINSVLAHTSIDIASALFVYHIWLLVLIEIDSSAPNVAAHAPPDGARRVDGVAQRRVRRLHSQIPEHPLVGLFNMNNCEMKNISVHLLKIYLYGVSLVVVVGEVEELEVERGPQPLHHLRVQPPHRHVAVA